MGPEQPAAVVEHGDQGIGTVDLADGFEEARQERTRPGEDLAERRVRRLVVAEVEVELEGRLLGRGETLGPDRAPGGGEDDVAFERSADEEKLHVGEAEKPADRRAACRDRQGRVVSGGIGIDDGDAGAPEHLFDDRLEGQAIARHRRDVDAVARPVAERLVDDQAHGVGRDDARTRRGVGRVGPRRAGTDHAKQENQGADEACHRAPSLSGVGIAR